MVTNLRTYNLALEFHKECQKLRLKYYLKDQLQRATSSVVLNLAEGSARKSAKERSHFYRIALGSLRESAAVLDIIGHVALSRQYDILGAHLYKLCKSCG